MSLLLDALKKAADDKLQKSKAPQDNSVPNEAKETKSTIKENPQDERVQSMELELDLKSTEEEYPEVSEVSISNNTTQSVDTKFDISEKLYSIDSGTKKETFEKELSLQKIDTDLDDTNLELSKQEKTTKHTNQDIKNNNSATTNLDSDVNNTHQKTNQSTSRIESEQALSALINKSNQYSRREKLKINISLAILAGIILIASGLYFYIEMQATNQNVYLSQNDQVFNSSPNTAPTTSQALPPTTTNSVAQTNNVPAVKPAPIKRTVATQKTIKPVLNKIIKPQLSTVRTANPTKPISIVHSKKIDPIHLLISDAYAAFQAERYHHSETLYKQALNREPKNRDALLGLAAIGIKEKRYEYARQKYQYLLRLNPADSFAIAGLSGLENHVDAQLSESQLKFMLKQQPDAAHLYFALGTQYSSQLKWAEAQSAYFSAWSADNKNADYCYNLAVSLDHLDKKQQALNFYQLSLKLMQQSNANFSQADTEQRIRSLQVSLL